MKHWFTLPYGDDLKESGRLHGWLHEHGWHATSWTWENGGPGGVNRFPGPRRMVATISPAWAPSVVQVTVISGVTLVYDDAEKTMGVTDKPEPQDARPAEPEDAVPQPFVDRYTDMSLFADEKPRMSLTDLFLDTRILKRRK